MCCPDQSSYELADRASLLEGNRHAGQTRHRPGLESLSWGQFRRERIRSLLYGLGPPVRNGEADRAAQFMAAVFQAGAIAPSARGGPRVELRTHHRSLVASASGR